MRCMKREIKKGDDDDELIEQRKQAPKKLLYDLLSFHNNKATINSLFPKITKESNHKLQCQPLKRYVSTVSFTFQPMPFVSNSDHTL